MKKFVPAFVLVFISITALATGWTAKFEQQKVFIHNKGQFDGMNNLPGSDILYGTDYGSAMFFFTKTGVTYKLTEKRAPTEEQREETERKMKRELREGQKEVSHEEMERAENRLIVKNDYVQVQWVNANPNVEVVAFDAVSNYFNFGLKVGSVEGLNGYKKLVYKNLYPGIDVMYVFHPENGIEYSFILHPGADASAIKMKYTDVSGMKTDTKGNLLLPTLFGNIIEHAPKSFYTEDKQVIASKFVRDGNIVVYELGDYNRSKEVVIDPWIQAPTFATEWDCVWECEKDGAGNAYLIGGVMPMQLIKYNSAGTIQWTYSTPYDTSNCWLGTFAVDNAGNSYVTAGSIAQIEKINTNGTLVWNNASPGGIFSTTEFWSITFNCDQTKLVIGGTGGGAFTLHPYIYQVDISNGNMSSRVDATGGQSIPDPNEVRSITACNNAKYYFLTHDSIGYINQNFAVCSNPSQARFYINNSYQLSYGCENFRINNTGIEAIKTYGDFVYVNRGNRLDKRNFATGAIITSATIPGGAFTTQFGRSYVENSGMDIDNCGNIYVGSKGQVMVFDQNLTQLATYPMQQIGSPLQTVNVYDVEVSTNGNIIACGSTGTSGSGQRYGSIQSIAASACSPVAITCCDANICGAGPFCINTAPVNLVASTPGVWSGSGITNASTGTFSPSAAGVGIHYIRNTIGCGSDSIRVIVGPCVPLSVCRENNGTYTVSNGVGSYTWNHKVTQQNCRLCVPALPPFIPACSFPPGCATIDTIWQTFATGSNVTPPGDFPLQVNDEYGTSLVINSAASVPSCNACTLTASASSTPATCGSNNGSATVTPGGGTASTYSWSNGGSTATISNLAAGTYTVTISGSGCSATASVNVTSTGTVSLTPSSNNATCGANNGSASVNATGGNGTFTYAWSNGGNASSITNVAAGTYTVTVTSNGCSATASATVGTNNNMSLTPSSSNATCGVSNGSASISAAGGNGSYVYSWSNGGTSASITNVVAGTYTVTVTSNGCSATSSITVSATNAVNATTSSTDAGCAPTGSATVNATGGNGSFTYVWSNGGNAATISNVAAGTYTVTVSSTGCTATASVTVNATGSVSTTTSVTNAGCITTGSATANPSGGTGTFSYAWSNGGNTATISNLSGGAYAVTVISGSCTATASATVVSTGGVTLSPSSTNTTCGNSNGTASVSVTTGASPYTYSWDNGGNGPSINNVAAGTYSVTVTDNSGCTATVSVVVNASSVSPAVITTNDSLICSGDSALICVSGSNFVSYHWNLGQTTQCITAKLAGNYYVTATDGNNCTVASNRIPISVYPLPPISVSVNGDTLTGYNAVTYQWYLNGVPIPGATSNMYIAPVSGDYTLAVTDSNGCHAVSTKVTVVTGIEELTEGQHLSVYPNPLENGLWNMDVSEGLLGSRVEVFDDRGRLVYKSEIRNQKSEITIEPASGIYMLRLSSNRVNVTRKLIKL